MSYVCKIFSTVLHTHRNMYMFVCVYIKFIAVVGVEVF